jgi:hypothetical protein
MWGSEVVHDFYYLISRQPQVKENEFWVALSELIWGQLTLLWLA